MLFNQPLGANDPAVHYMMVGASNPSILAPGAFPGLFSENGLFSGVAEGLNTPLPLPEPGDWITPQIPGIAQVTNGMTQMILDGDTQGAEALAAITTPGALADINSLGVGNSINESNLRIFGGTQDISNGLEALTGVGIVSGATVGINEPSAI